MGASRKILTGTKEIAGYTGMSEGLILKLIRTAAFPARKTAGANGIWVSNMDSIDEWSHKFSTSATGVSITKKD